MKLNFTSSLFLVCLVQLLFLPAVLSAQATVNPDSLFKLSRQLAYEGKYESSRQVARQLLQVAPDYTDATILLARTFAWQEQYDSARYVLLPLLNQTPPPADALLTLADLEHWADNPALSLRFANQGVKYYPQSIPLLLAKARVHTAMGNTEAAINTLQQALIVAPHNTEVKKALAQIKDAAFVNRIRSDYQISLFSPTARPWHLGALEYTRLTPKGRYIGRINYAERYEQRSIQGEVEAYPQLNDKTYAYLNLGASDQKLFPSYRAGAELYRLLPFKTEASLGARALFFQSETVILYTGHIGKYFPKHWVSFRPFLQRQHNTWQTTGILQLRQYLQHEDEFITLVLSRGSIPAVQVGFQEINRLNSNRVGLEGQFRLGSRYLLGGLFHYEYEEYQQDTFRNRFTVGLSVQAKF